MKPDPTDLLERIEKLGEDFAEYFWCEGRDKQLAKWIAVEDKLPPNYTDVWVTHSGTIPYPAYFISGNFFLYNFEKISLSTSPIKPNLWMPWNGAKFPAGYGYYEDVPQPILDGGDDPEAHVLRYIKEADAFV